MPKFKVHLQQYVEEVATMEIDAPDEKTARDIAKDRACEADWSDGNDADPAEVYAVHDENDNLIWER